MVYRNKKGSKKEKTHFNDRYHSLRHVNIDLCRIPLIKACCFVMNNSVMHGENSRIFLLSSMTYSIILRTTVAATTYDVSHSFFKCTSERKYFFLPRLCFASSRNKYDLLSSFSFSPIAADAFGMNNTSFSYLSLRCKYC